MTTKPPDSRSPGVAKPAGAPAPKPTPKADTRTSARSWAPSSATVNRDTALASLHRAPSPAPGRVPVAAPGVASAKSKLPADARRKYPRLELGVKARLSMADSPNRFFEAALPTVNISVGGMFLQSSFFLKLGTKLLVELTLPPKGRMVRVKGEVVRVETSDEGHAGFALRFTEYLDGSEVILATHFLSPVLREFLAAYAKQHRFEASPEYIAHTADVLAAWELRKAELGGDVWNLVPQD